MFCGSVLPTHLTPRYATGVSTPIIRNNRTLRTLDALAETITPFYHVAAHDSMTMKEREDNLEAGEHIESDNIGIDIGG